MRFLIFFLMFIYSNATTFSISVCTTSTQKGADSCKEGILKSSDLEVFILQDSKDKKFRTYLGKFDSHNQAKMVLNSSSSFIKKQQPFITKLKDEITSETIENKSVILEEKLETKVILEQEIVVAKEPEQIIEEKVEPIIELEKVIVPKIEINVEPEEKTIEIEPLEELPINEEKIAIAEETKVDLTVEKNLNSNNTKNENDLISQIESYDKLIVEVDSTNNTMLLKANINEELIDLKSYKVSTGKKNVKKPLGNGSISAISLTPQWYPTADTLRSFKRRGINLPSVVPYGHRLNSMGAAKINLTHRVDGKETYRIHGTLNEKTIGTNESAGCIRMKNSEVLQLAKLLNAFAKIKDYSNIDVILK